MFKNVENICFGTFFVLEIFLKNGYFMMKKLKKMKNFQISKIDISYFIFSIFVLSYPITWGSLGASAPRFGAQTRP